MTTLLKLLALGSALALTSCSTVSGIGKDIQKGGAALENSAEKHQR